MSRFDTCHYCGWTPAKIRRPGEPATCFAHRDLPQRERERDNEVERLVNRLYEGDG